MSASKYRCSFQLSVKGSWVCINVRFCVFCCNNNPEMGCLCRSCLDQPALLLQTSSSHQAVDKKESAHWSYCYLCLRNSTLEMMQETETVFGDLLALHKFGPRLRPATCWSGWNSDELSARFSEADLYFWSRPAGWQARKGFFRWIKRKNNHH